MTALVVLIVASKYHVIFTLLTMVKRVSYTLVFEAVDRPSFAYVPLLMRNVVIKIMYIY